MDTTIFVVIPMNKGYTVETYNPKTKEKETSAHNTRKNAVIGILNKIPKEKQFQIFVMDEEGIK